MSRMHFEVFAFDRLRVPLLQEGQSDGSGVVEVALRLHVQVMASIELPHLKVVVNVPLDSL